MNLNWKEIEILVKALQALRPPIEGAFVDRFVIAERKKFPEGYLKGEFAIRLGGQVGCLLISIRPRSVYLTWAPGKGPVAAAEASKSPFILAAAKKLDGARLKSVEAIPRERVVILWFTKGDNKSEREKLGLVLVLIPASPEAFLVREGEAGGPPPWFILARSRSGDGKEYSPPNGAGAPEDLPIRAEWFNDGISGYSQCVEKELEKEATQKGNQSTEKILQQQIKQAKDRLRQGETALKQVESEPDWQRLGDLLKSALGEPPELIREKSGSYREVLDYTTDEKVQIPCDSKLDIKQQVEKFYSNAKRNQRKKKEAQARIEEAQKALAQLEKGELANAKNPAAGVSRTLSGPKGKEFKGKEFISPDGFPIWVGRSREENLDLTFKLARGNDLWLHVRGRPGAHVIVQVPAGKSVPLSTLLEAAQLAIAYSGGESWGKTEVDYTFKKFVKRIKDSSEVSYTHNKTLLVEPKRRP